MNKKQVFIIIGLIAVSFAAGRFLTPEKVKIEKQVVEVEKKEQSKQIDEKKVIVEEVKPDGSKTTTTTVDTKTNINTTVSKDKTTDESKVVEVSKSKLNVSILAGLDIIKPENGFVYGAHISKELLGPITFGLFGQTNKTFGVSIGLNF